MLIKFIEQLLSAWTVENLSEMTRAMVGFRAQYARDFLKEILTCEMGTNSNAVHSSLRLLVIMRLSDEPSREQVEVT